MSGRQHILVYGHQEGIGSQSGCRSVATHHKMGTGFAVLYDITWRYLRSVRASIPIKRSSMGETCTWRHHSISWTCYEIFSARPAHSPIKRNGHYYTMVCLYSFSSVHCTQCNVQIYCTLESRHLWSTPLFFVNTLKSHFLMHVTITYATFYWKCLSDYIWYEHCQTPMV